MTTDTNTTGVGIVESLDAGEWAPFSHPTPDGGTATFGEIRWARQQGSDGSTLLVAFWRSEAGTSPLYDFFAGDESGYVIRGSATVTLVDAGQEVELRAGDAYSFDKGTLSRWTVHESFVKFLVIAALAPDGQ